MKIAIGGKMTFGKGKAKGAPPGADFRALAEYHYPSINSHKFYEVWVQLDKNDMYAVHYRYGRVGSAGKTDIKTTYPKQWQAIKRAKEMMRGKINKGYVLKEGGPV